MARYLPFSMAPMAQPDMLPTLTGAENRPPPGPPSPTLLQQLLTAGMGAFNPLGLTPPPRTVMQSPGQALTGRPLPPSPRTVSFDPGGSPAAELAGSAFGFAPMARLGGRALQVARDPRAIAALAATGGGAATTLMEPATVGAQRQPQPTNEILAEQRMLAREGHYKGTIDGVDGPETQAARATYAAAQERRRQQQAEREQLELQRAQTEAERERLRLQQATEKRLGEEGERAARLQAEGAERFNARKPGFMEEYGPYLGYGFGLTTGFGGRWGMGRVLNREARERSTRAGDMARQMGTGDVPERVGRVNEFWATGAPAASPPPFSFQTGRQPFPWSTNPNAASPDQLYRSAGALATYGPPAVTLGAGAVETAGGYAWLANARQELQAANEALESGGTTPANVQRLEAATAAVAQAETLIRSGVGTIAGGTVGELEALITRGRLRPSTRAADAERGRLDAMLNPQPAPPPPRPPMQRHPAGARDAQGRPIGGRYRP